MRTLSVLVLGIADLLFCTSSAQAAVVEVVATSQGWITQDGVNNLSSSSKNHLAGNCILASCTVSANGEFRNYYQFSIPTLSGSITSVQLKLNNYLVDTDQSPSLTYSVTSAPSSPTFASLGTGTFYGARTYTPDDSFLVQSIGLNSSSFSAILAVDGTSSFFNIGGRVTSPTDFGSTEPNQQIFGRSQSAGEFPTLVITTEVPVSNPVVDLSLKGWASDAQELFENTGKWLTLAGDVASWIDGKIIKEIALKRVLTYTAEKITEWSTTNVIDDIVLTMYNQIGLIEKLFNFGTAPASATVAGAKFINKGVILGLGEIIEDPPRFDYGEVRALLPAFDSGTLGAISTNSALSQSYLDMISCSADMADGTYAMLLSAERAWGASLDNAVNALALQRAAYGEAASKANIALSRCSQAAQDLAGFITDPQALMALKEMGWHLVNDDDIDALRQFFLSTGLVDATLIDQAFAAAYEDNALFINPAEFADFQDIATRMATLGPAPIALRQAQVPEPSALALVVLALGLLMFARRASKRPSSPH